jgi:hypothetical protein
MEFRGSKKNGRKDALDDVIAFFSGTVEHLPEVKLDKLIYIAHLYHYASFGDVLTKTRFFSLSFGPHAPGVRSAVKRLVENKSVFLKASRTSSDPIYSNPCLIIRAGGPAKKGDFSAPPSPVLQEVLADWGEKAYEAILEYVARTVSFLSTPYREPIDWTLSPPHRGLIHTLSYHQRVFIHRFVEKPETPVDQPDALCREAPLSVPEVAEIYLAACGEPPDRIPSREALGFDLPSVFRVIDKEGGAHQSRPSNDADDMEGAARIAAALLTALSFRTFSARVALKTGMFFLRKKGYCFDGDVLGEHWPKGNSYEVLKEWFGRLSLRVDTHQETC